MNKIKLYTLNSDHECSYLPDTQANSVFLDPNDTVDINTYNTLNKQGFRRSGSHYYRPHCPSCNACTASRLLVADFQWKRRFKRLINKNKHLTLSIEAPVNNATTYDLFERYINKRHTDGDMYPASEKQFEDFLVSGREDSRFLCAYDQNKLIGIAVIDLLDDGISAIYSFFDPEYEKNGLGTWLILQNILLAKEAQATYVYLGYYIEHSKKMNYKADYQPLELFKNNQWEPFDSGQHLAN
jgi:arginine-tRNA-protein transferase